MGVPSAKAMENDNPQTGIANSPHIDRWKKIDQSITIKETRDMPSRRMMMVSFVSFFIAVVFYFHCKYRINI